MAYTKTQQKEKIRKRKAKMREIRSSLLILDLEDGKLQDSGKQEEGKTFHKLHVIVVQEVKSWPLLAPVIPQADYEQILLSALSLLLSICGIIRFLTGLFISFLSIILYSCKPFFAINFLYRCVEIDSQLYATCD